MIFSFVNNYFGFNKQQRNGLLVLISISFMLLLIRLIYPYFITPENIVVKDLPLAKAPQDKTQQSSKKELFIFDPNRVTEQQLLQLGFTEKSARAFVNFRKKGFVFRSKSDLKKVYGVSDKLYTSIEPWILFGTNGTSASKQLRAGVVSSKQTADRIELNSADSLALISLPGIGESFARRVIKYRSLLGGYVSVEQLKEVYGFTEELYTKVKDKVKADPALIHKLNLNKDDFKTINKHPYISYELTKSIFDWRRKTIITADNLKEVLNQDEALYLRLLPYLDFP